VVKISLDVSFYYPEKLSCEFIWKLYFWGYEHAF